MSKQRVAVLGSGVWGCAFAYAVADSRHALLFWDRHLKQAQAAVLQVPDGVIATACKDIDEAISGADLVVISVGSNAFTQILKQVANHPLPPLVVWLTKGFDTTTNRPLCQSAADLLGKEGRYAVISGPSFAQEVLEQKPTALTVVANHHQDNLLIQQYLHRKHLRLYPQEDMIGVCVGGATKNVIAIAAGISDAMKLGENARASLITRGLMEMIEISEGLGGKRQTLLGLAGVGDLLLTCSSDLSRNRQLGLAIGRHPEQHFSFDAIKKLTAAKTCEGLNAIAPVLGCVNQLKLEVPIIRSVADVLKGNLSPQLAFNRLLERPPRQQ